MLGKQGNSHHKRQKSLSNWYSWTDAQSCYSEKHSQAKKMIIGTGRVFELTKGIQSKREKLGLKELKPIDELKELVE